MELMEMSFMGAVLVVVVVLLRTLLINRLPKKTFLVLWGIVALRLLVPFQITSRWSIYSVFPVEEWRLESRLTQSLLNGSEQEGVSPVTIGETQFKATQDKENEPDAKYEAALEKGGATVNGNTSILRVGKGHMLDFWWERLRNMLNFVRWGGTLWWAGWFGMVYFKCRRRFSTSLPVESIYVTKWLDGHSLSRRIQVRQTDCISTPLTYGILYPVILLPKGMDMEDREELGYVLTHELVHIRRLDALTKLVLVTTVCIHWFNPFVWLMYFLCNRDLELSCDETVIHIYGGQSREEYAMMLIHMAERGKQMPALYNYFGKNAGEERIKAIMKTKKFTIVGCVAAVLLVGIVAVVFAASGKDTDKEENLAEKAKLEEMEKMEESLQVAEETKVEEMKTLLENAEDKQSVLEAEAARREAEIAEKEAEVAKREAEIKVLRDVIKEGKAVVSQSEEQAGEVTEWLRKLEDMEVEIAGKEAEIKELMAVIEREKAAASQLAEQSGEVIGWVNIVEGMEEWMQVKIMQGNGYSIYFPVDESWVYEDSTSLRSSTDADIFLTVYCYQTLDAAEVRDTLLSDGYTESAAGVFQRKVKAEDGAQLVQYMRLTEDIYSTYGVLYSYPDTTEMAEGVGTRLENIANSFRLNTDNLTRDGEELKTAAMGFVSAYLEGNPEKCLSYMSSVADEDYKQELEQREFCCVGAKPRRLCIGRVDTLQEGDSAGLQIECVNPKPGEGNIYLDLQFRKENGAMKITSFGWEM